MAKIFCDARSTQTSGASSKHSEYYFTSEYSADGVFSVKSDVYSFGVLLVEVVSGVRTSSDDGIMDFPSLIAYAWNLRREGKASELLDQSMVEGCSPDEALLCIHVGLLCVQDDTSWRPLMLSVVSILENGTRRRPCRSGS